MNLERTYQILLGAHISEKATIIADRANQIAFKVAGDATKPEIKEAVEKLYGVTVENVKGKVKRTMRGLSHRPGWKKAYVRLQQGHDIDFSTTHD